MSAEPCTSYLFFSNSACKCIHFPVQTGLIRTIFDGASVCDNTKRMACSDSFRSAECADRSACFISNIAYKCKHADIDYYSSTCMMTLNKSTRPKPMQVTIFFLESLTGFLYVPTRKI